MARHTTCRPIAQLDTIGWLTYAGGIVAAVAGVAAGVAIALALLPGALLSANPVTIGIAAGVLLAGVLGAIATLEHIRDYFFDGRLGCIAEERCALGRVGIIEDNADGDLSLNLLLAPAQDATTEAQYREMWQAKELVFMDPGVASGDPSWVHKPIALRLGEDPIGQGPNLLPFFHCEIEGKFFDDWTSALIAYMWGLAALATGLLALAVAGTVAGPLGWIVVAAVALLLLLALLFGLVPGQDDIPSGETEPVGSAVPGAMGPIVTDSGGNTVSVGDHVIVSGRHVVDTGHASKGCWNELHPVRGIAKVRSEEYDRVDNSPEGQAVVQRYCEALKGFVDKTGTTAQPLTCLEHPRIG